MDLHTDLAARETMTRQYLYRRMSEEDAERFEEHYLSCNECFEEIRATELLIRSLDAPVIARRQVDDVQVLAFPEDTHLLAESLPLNELAKVARLQSDTKVLIDLTRVSRIDSTGLGILMNCYCHAVKNAGALKLLNPKPPVRQVLAMTRLDSVLETFDDEDAAILSFRNSGANV